MEYLHVAWDQDSADFPVDIYTELDDERWEVRKVEVFPDGHLQYADDWEGTGNTGLGEHPTPAIEEMRGGGELTPEVIDQATFERMWEAATRPGADR